MSILFGSELSVYCAATASFYRWQKLRPSEIVLTWCHSSRLVAIPGSNALDLFGCSKIFSGDEYKGLHMKSCPVYV